MKLKRPSEPVDPSSWQGGEKGVKHYLARQSHYHDIATDGVFVSEERSGQLVIVTTVPPDLEWCVPGAEVVFGDDRECEVISPMWMENGTQLVRVKDWRHDRWMACVGNLRPHDPTLTIPGLSGRYDADQIRALVQAAEDVEPVGGGEDA